MTNSPDANRHSIRKRDATNPAGPGNKIIQVEPHTWVANLIGQRDIKRDKAGNPPIRYDAVAAGLGKLGGFAAARGASVTCPASAAAWPGVRGTASNR